ncbi:MAG: hypothetical protein ACKO4L_01835, partial [Nodosilinea sp.]
MAPPILNRSIYRKFLGSTLAALLVGWGVIPAWGADPFRVNQPHDIGPAGEAVFTALFYEDDYSAARQLARTAIAQEPQEPINYAITAALNYLSNDLEGLLQQARLTQQTADALKGKD